MSAEVLVRFIGDTRQLQGQIAQVEGTGNKLKSWAKGVGAAVGGALVIKGLSDSVNAAAELGDVLSANEAIFGSASTAVQRWAEANANAFMMSQRQAVDAANTFATFGKSAGLSGKDLAGFSTDLTGLAGDLASFKGTSTEEAIGAIGSALRGESEPIRKYGVLLDDATLRQKALELGLIATTKDALTPQQKVLAANAAIWEQTKDAQGDAARTSDSAANQQKKLTAQIEDTQAAIGTALLPVMQALLPVVRGLAKFFQEHADVLVPLVGIIGAVVAATWLWNAALAANPIGLIVIGIAALIAAIVLIIQNFDVVKEAAGAVWGAIQTAFDAVLNIIRGVWEWISANWPLLLAILTGPFGLAVLFIVENWDSILAFFKSLPGLILGFLSTLFEILTFPYRKAAEFALDVFGRVVDFFRELPGKIADALSTVWNVITAPFREAIDWVKGAVGGIGDAFDGAINAVKRIWNAFARFWNRIEIKVPGVDVPFVGEVGGFTVGLPDLPIAELARGGIVTGPTLALIGEAGREAVVPLPPGGALGTSNVYNIHISVSPTASPADVGAALIDAIRSYERANGATWRATA